MPSSKPSADKLRSQCKERFSFFCRLMQGEGYFDPVHAELCDFIQSQCTKSRHPHALIIMPRGSYKTTVVSKWFPIWVVLNNPNYRWLITSNSMPNASSKLRDIRGAFESHPILRGLFGEIIPAPNDRKVRWNDHSVEVIRSQTFAEATFEAAGIRSKIIGRHYDGIIEDDTCAPDLSDVNAEYVLPDQADIQQAIGYHKLAYPLLVRPKEGIRCVVGTYWSYDDVLTWIQDNESTYAVFNRKAMDHFPKGQCLFSHIDLETLHGLRTSMGKFMFNSLYLNDPTRPEDMIFKPEEIKTLSDLGMTDVPEDCDWVISVDPAISTKKDACDTAIVRVGHKRPMMFVDTVMSGRYTPMETAQHIINLIRLDYENTKWVGVETVNFQEVLVFILEDLMREQKMWFPVQKIPPQRAKHDRILSLQPYFERGQIVIRDDMAELKAQLVNYPHYAKRDIVDSLAMQILSYQGVVRERSKPRIDTRTGYTLEEILETVRGMKQKKNFMRPARKPYGPLWNRAPAFSRKEANRIASKILEEQTS